LNKHVMPLINYQEDSWDPHWRRLAGGKWQVHRFNTKTPLPAPLVIIYMVLFVQLWMEPTYI